MVLSILILSLNKIIKQPLHSVISDHVELLPIHALNDHTTPEYLCSLHELPGSRFFPLRFVQV